MNDNPYRTPLEMGSVPPARGKFPSGTLTEWLVMPVIITVLFALLEPAVQAAVEASRRHYCSNSVKQPINPELARRVHSQQKHKLDRLAESWGIADDAIAPILAAVICLGFFPAIILTGMLANLWDPADPSPAEPGQDAISTSGSTAL